MSYGFSPDEIRSKLSFYHLDKLKEGEYVLVYWQGKEYPYVAVSYTHLRAHETVLDLVCRLLLEKKKTKQMIYIFSF